jgi:FlaA1/EpsC-like NDP-sugar epimerase
VARRLEVTQAIIAMPGATHGERKRAVEQCVAAGLKVMTVPAYSDIVSGKVSVSALRDVELDDLLGRDPVRLDDAGLHRLLEGKRVLVTGAGGSIGAGRLRTSVPGNWFCSIFPSSRCTRSSRSSATACPEWTRSP